MLENLILYFVYKTKGFITKTQLVKFLYLADLYSVKWTEKQLTGLDWRYYTYGPWNEEIDSALNHLEGKIIQKIEGKATLIQPCDDSFKIDNHFPVSTGLRFMLDNIRREWAGLGSDKLEQLLDYVYSTAPMADIKSKHAPEEKARLNLQLEREMLVRVLGA